MTEAVILGQLSSIHELLLQLPQSVAASDANRQFHKCLGSLSWYLGRSVYQEMYWLREVVAQDDDLTKRVAGFFVLDAHPLSWQCDRLPPRHHLINWASEILDEDLRRLANPGSTPSHPLLERDRLQWFLLQEHAKNYERMLAVLTQRSLTLDQSEYLVTTPLRSRMPEAKCAEVNQGYYRIGAKNGSAAYDNERPPQAVELTGFRIARQPVNNSHYLAFIESGGYDQADFWDPAALSWLRDRAPAGPDHWRRDRSGNWYGVGVNGPADLPSDQPVMGISHYEASAYAKWVSSLGGQLAGAVVQHEYQWEVAARAGLISGTGQAWEWCANTFHPYPEFVPFPSTKVSEQAFSERHHVLRGGSLHTQRPLRRPSLRRWERPEYRHVFAGTRLVFPPSD